MNKRVSVKAVVVALVLFSSCTSVGSDQPDRSDPTDSSIRPATSTTDMEPSESFEDHTLRVAEWYDSREDLVQACMAAEGFDYYPEYVPANEIEAATQSAAMDLESDGPQRLIPPEPESMLSLERELRATVGFAVFFGQDEVEDANVSVYDRAELPEGRPAPDTGRVSPSVAQNREYVDSLPDDARDEYWIALYGDEDDSESPAPVAGCYAEAQEVVGSRPTRINLDIARHIEAEERVLALAASDPRVIAAASGYTECMAAEGYVVQDSMEAYAQAAARADAEIEGLMEAGVDLEPLFANGAWGEVLEPERLDQLQAQEIDFALLDWDCAQEVRTIRETVILEIEQEVLSTDYRDVAVDLGLEL